MHACEGTERGEYKGDCCGCGLQQKQQEDVRIPPSPLSLFLPLSIAPSPFSTFSPPFLLSSLRPALSLSLPLPLLSPFFLPFLSPFFPPFLSPSLLSFLPPFLSPFFPPLSSTALFCLMILHFFSSDSQLRMRRTCPLCCGSVHQYLPTPLPSKGNWPSRNRTKPFSRLPKTSSATSVSHVMSHDHHMTIT